MSAKAKSSQAGVLSSPAPPPLVVLTFAEGMLATVRKRRAEQLAAGQIDRARHDSDLAAAEELVRLAQDVLIFGGPMLN